MVGKLKENPGIFSQGETLKELEGNIRGVYKLMVNEKRFIPSQEVYEKTIGVSI
jgi:predicted RNase H-like HicB family nuclease